MLESLLTPKSIAVVGASRSPGKVGHEILANLVSGGFTGRVYPVNPSSDSILDLKCYPSTEALPSTIDLSVIAVPAPAVRAAVQGSIEAGAQAIVVITAGFKETGTEGARLEKELLDLVKAHGVRLLGPNCLGIINVHHRMNASFAKQMPPPGAISVISQSGALCTAMLDLAAARHMGIAKMVSIGNKADISEVDLLKALAADEDTKVIVGYLENIVSGSEFMKAAEAATAVKPVIIQKAGTTQSGMRAASSHTGSLAGADVAYAAAFRHSGVIRADGFEALFDYAVAFAMQPLPKGNRIAIITNAGGPGIMAADAVEKNGMKVTALGRGTAAALRSKLPAAASVGNPIDVLGDADPERYRTAIEAAQDDNSVDAIITILTPQAMTRPAETARALAAAMRGEKPVLATFMGGRDIMPGREELVQHNLPDYPSPERAVEALKAMVDYSAWRARPPRVLARFPVNRRRVERILARHIRIRRFQVGEAAAKDVMRAYGFPVPPGRLATSVEDAVEAATGVGYPVAMKIVSPDIVHKSDVGGVRLHLESPDAVRDAYDLMTLRIERRTPDAHVEGVYVERMSTSGREVILGMSRDPAFGPMLMFGLGGIFVEVMKDVTFNIAPITAGEALQMLEGTRSFALLKGARGQASVDLDALANALQRISQLVTDFPQIAELDINPFIVGPIGAESAVVDARITLSDGPAPARETTEEYLES